MPENKGVSILTIFKIISFSVIFLMFQQNNAFANHAESAEQHNEHETSSGKFKPGEMILDHVKDAHDWHLWDWKGHAVSIPLPIILFDNGLHIFSSSKFEHGHAVVEKAGNFYALHHGHIYKTNEHGTIEMGEKNAVLNAQPLDFSITKNVFALIIASIIILFIFLSIAKSYKTRGKSAPKGLQSLIEPIIVFIRDEVVKPSVGHHYEKFLPLLLTIFFFIFINNLMGLIPIFPFGANVTGNIAVTLVLSIVVFLVVSFNGNKHYWKHIFMPDVPPALWVLLIPIEILGVVLKPFVLMLRLFANITAGHIIILGFFSLIFIFGEKSPIAGGGTAIFSVAFTLFMSVLELLVAFLQAYVFTLLASLYIGSATEEHHHSEEHH
ncbi:MAG: F0F1 ATP synthase subunit A [Bacteroidota bacterium]|nr:F0F1 ATP synthase subunit A [Bacteroidota bacterium]